MGGDTVTYRAGVGKAPLYLRWTSKEDLLLAAFSAYTSAITIRDSRNLRDDPAEYACRLIETDVSPEGPSFLRIHLEASVITCCTPGSTARSPARTGEARALLQRALDRGAGGRHENPARPRRRSRS
jgi:AcrR family transcriptional regulator